MSLLYKDTWRLGQCPSWIRAQLCAFNTQSIKKGRNVCILLNGLRGNNMKYTQRVVRL